MKNLMNDDNIESLEIPEFDFENSKPNKYTSMYSEDNQTIVYKERLKNCQIESTDKANALFKRK